MCTWDKNTGQPKNSKINVCAYQLTDASQRKKIIFSIKKKIVVMMGVGQSSITKKI